MTGLVASVKGKDRFVVSIRFIHRAVSVELGRDELVPGEKSPPRPGRAG
jgi:hypothetical protein